MSDTNLLAVGTTSGGGWSLPDNVKVEDATNVAYHNFTYLEVISPLLCTNFGAAIPAGSTITGLQVFIKRNASYASIHDTTVQLSYSGSAQGDNKADTGTNWPTGVPEFAGYGTHSDTWGYTGITPAIVNHSSFGVYVNATNSDATARLGQIDYVCMTVYYTSGWGGKVMGVTNPAKVIGIAKENITKVMGKTTA